MCRSAWLLLGLLLGCAADPAPPASRILLVSFDTTRADRIGAYGYGDAHTPTLDRLARDGVLYETALAPTPITLPSHASLLTGLYPPAHGVRDNALFSLASEARLVSEVFRDHGWRTGAFVGSAVLDPRAGLDQGFQVYRGVPFGTGVAVPSRRAEEVVDDALAWIATLPADARFFAWVHFMDPHSPYDPPAPWSERVEGAYDGEIAYADEQLGRLLGQLAQRGLGRDLAVVATADHGESLGDHGEQTHGLFVYDAAVRVPLIFSGGPVAGRGRRVAIPVSLVAVPGTLLALAGLPPGDMTLAPGVLESGAVPGAARPIYLETLYPFHTYRWRGLDGLVWRDHKLVRGHSSELYATSDRAEANDLAGREPALVRELESRLERLLAEQPTLDLADERVPGPEEAGLLESLGYAVGDAHGDPFAGDLPDVHERLRSWDLLQSAERRIALAAANSGAGPTAWQRGERDREQRLLLQPARDELREVHRDDPENPRVLRMLAFVEHKLGNWEEAVSLTERAIAATPRMATLRYQLGLVYESAGRPDDALREMRSGVLLEPRLSSFYGWLAQHYFESGDVPRLAWWVRAGLEAVPPDAPLRVDLQRWNQQADLELRRLGAEPEPPPDFPVEEFLERIEATGLAPS